MKLYLFASLILTLASLQPVALTIAQKPTDLTTTATSSLPAVTIGQNKLADAKLRACQNREQALQKRSQQLVQLATTQLAAFSAIATRVENYYTQTLLPSGLTVANYDTLLATIISKQTAIPTAISQASLMSQTFSCLGTAPKAQLDAFRTIMIVSQSDLKDYRTSIKNLIVAVRTATASRHQPSTTTSSSPSPTRE